MTGSAHAALHDAYAASYDADVQAYDCHVAEVLFGLCYDRVSPGQRLLDVGTGSGLSAELFAKAGLEIYGMDFSPAMLKLCKAKGFAKDLKQHDVIDVPWPYPPGSFDNVTCCGVMHFIADLHGVFSEAARCAGSWRHVCLYHAGARRGSRKGSEFRPPHRRRL